MPSKRSIIGWDDGEISLSWHYPPKIMKYTASNQFTVSGRRFRYVAFCFWRVTYVSHLVCDVWMGERYDRTYE